MFNFGCHLSIPGNKASENPEKLLKSLKKYQDFFNHSQTEHEELSILLATASKKTLDWLTGEISKAKNWDYDPEWGDDVKAYKVGNFFTLAKEKLEEKTPEEIIIVAEEKKAPGRLNFGKANGQGDLLSQIRAMKQEEAREIPTAAPSVSSKVKDFIANAKKAGGDLFASIRAGKNEEAEEVFAAQPKIISPTGPVIEPEVILFSAPPPPPPPPFVGWVAKGKGKSSDLIDDLAPKGERLPEIEKPKAREDDLMKDVHSSMLKRRAVIHVDEDDDSDSDFND